MYVQGESGVDCPQDLNSRDPMLSIRTGVVPDSEERHELCRQTAPQRTIHLFRTSLDPNSIIATPRVPEVSGSRASRTVDVVNVAFLERHKRYFELR